MATLRKNKGLTKQERYQFSLTGSTAQTTAAQRAAIARCGLVGATPASVLKVRREAFAAFRSKQKDLHGQPAWLAAARYEASGSDWQHVAPIKAGVCRDSSVLAAMAYDAINWGRLRKHSRGKATAFAPRVREETNGKSGWDCVVFRYADYLSVLSPDGRKIAVQVDKSPLEVHAVWRGRFMFRGRLICLSSIPTTAIPYNVCIRARCELLRRSGYAAARIVRQTKDMVAAGSGETLRTGGKLYCVIPDGLGGWYHVAEYERIESVRAGLVRRRIDGRDKELDAIVSTSAARIWVTVEDSVSAGNCRPGTEAFRAQLEQRLQVQGDVGAVRADVVLSIRDDQFTRRALRVAAMRFKATAL